MTDNKKERQQPNEREMSAQEVADHFGISRVAVLDIERRALRKAYEKLKWQFEKQDIIPD